MFRKEIEIDEVVYDDPQIDNRWLFSWNFTVNKQEYMASKYFKTKQDALDYSNNKLRVDGLLFSEFKNKEYNKWISKKK